MGCFDSNCCLTGLPLHYNDKVKAAIIIEDPFMDGYYGSPASSWQFITPPISSSYNDYGNIEFNEVNQDEVKLLDLFFQFWKPGLELREQYPSVDIKSDKTSWTTQEMWDACIHRHMVYDPNRSRRKEIITWQSAGCPKETKPVDWFKFRREDKYPVYETKSHVLAPWMCHEWAWNTLYKYNTK